MPTIRDAAHAYLRAAALRRSRSWVRHQRTYLDNEILPLWGELDVAAVTPAMVEDYVASCAARLKKTTVNKRLSCLRRLFAWLVSRDEVERNPAAAVPRLPDDTSLRSNILSRAEVERMLEVAAPKLRLFITLAYHTGVRAGEAKRLGWRDVDLPRRRLRVRGEKAGTERVEKVRWVPINDELATALATFRELPEGDHEFLFEHGGTRDWSNLNRAFNQAVERAGLDPEHDITPHTLRHTFGAELVMRGVPIRKVQLLMGHSTVLTTETWYAHWSPDWLQGATDVLTQPSTPPKKSPGVPPPTQPNRDEE